MIEETQDRIFHIPTSEDIDDVIKNFTSFCIESIYSNKKKITHWLEDMNFIFWWQIDSSCVEQQSALITVSLPKAWQRAETVNGVPYYINHDTETTHWDHPEMTQLMTDMSVADDIKYAAYRTAVKLRAIEKITQLYLIDLSTIRAGFNDLGYSESFTEDEVDVQSFKGILKEIFSYQSAKSNDVDVADGVELTLNWLLNVYDKTRSGSLRILSAKIGLACLSVASVQEKYKYIFDQLSSSKGFIDKKRLRVFLKDGMQMLKYIREYNSFGRAGVEPAVQSCFERAFIPERICLQEFLDWMIDEPQTVVWLPTLHRLAMSETVKHEGKCNICKMFPIVGFRYRCLKCFNFDLCQNCFWSGRVSKNHKLTHQTQEYCLPATQKEDVKDFAKVVKSKVRKIKRKTKRKVPSKSRFLPISNDGTAQASDEEKGADHVDYGDNESTTSFESRISSPLRETDKTTSKEIPTSSSRVLRSRPVLDDEHQLISYYTSCLNDSPQPTTSTPIQTLARLDHEQVKELDEIVENLEDDNSYLREKILEIQDVEARRSLGQTEEKERIEEYNERLEARQEVLEDHNQRLEDQLAKLRSLIQQGKYVPGGNNVDMQTPTIFSRSEDILNHPYKSIDAACQYRKDPVKRTQSSSTSPYNYERLQPLPVSKDTPQYSSVQSKQNMTSHSKHSTSTGYPWENVSERHFKMPDANDDIATTIISTTSDDDLRAIELRLERLLEPDIAEEDEKAREGVESKAGMLDDSADPNFSDDQQNYLLSAASMVGEAVEDFVSSLSRESSGWNYLKLDFTDDEEEV